MTTVHYVDANLHHDLVTGRAVTAVLHIIIVNGTPTDWYFKRQATVETATYGSEYVAARIAVDQIVDLRYTLTYLGVPIRSKSFMLGDIKSIITSSTIPNSLCPKGTTFQTITESGSQCLEIPHVYLERWQDQPIRHSQQALGVPSDLAST